MRDTQRSKVYRAERAIDKYSKRYETVEEIDAFLKSIWSRKRLQKKYHRALKWYEPPSIKDGRGTRIARGGAWHLNLPLWSRFSTVILHEVSHCIQDRLQRIETQAAHGREFCEIFLTVVREMLGREAHDLLKASFKKHRVRFTKPRKKRTLSPERRAQLAAQLAAARLKKAA